MRILFAVALAFAVVLASTTAQAAAPDQAKPDQTKPDQAKPDQAKPDQTKHVKPDQAKPDQVKSGKHKVVRLHHANLKYKLAKLKASKYGKQPHYA